MADAAAGYRTVKNTSADLVIGAAVDQPTLVMLIPASSIETPDMEKVTLSLIAPASEMTAVPEPL